MGFWVFCVLGSTLTGDLALTFLEETLIDILHRHGVHGLRQDGAGLYSSGIQECFVFTNCIHGQGCKLQQHTHPHELRLMLGSL